MAGEPEKPKDDAETVFMPSLPPTSGSAKPSTPPPGAEHVLGRVSIGDVLNGIYEVKRLIGRGGMGEVYEGVNINSDERVAIKVMLPSLAADAKVQAMFRKEARTLTRLAHPAVVQYRVLAHEPLLNVLYIVTEFVDGVELTAVLGQIHPTSAELKGLIRRLADGLRAAHDLGAVHRDMSPDNVLLPERRLDRARIIDFGIAKDLDPTKATIVGDGFAGKLAYVAPEQFGDFGREIGPWTDVYSLGLIILALASGKDVDMGTTLVEAVDKRRAGIDLTPIPEDLRPVLERMLAADPAKRARSMDEVLAMLGEPSHTFPPTQTTPPIAAATLAAAVAPAAAPATTPPTAAAEPVVRPAAADLPRPVAPAANGPPVVGLVIAGVLAIVVIGGALGYLMLPKKPPPHAGPAAGQTAAAGAPAPGGQTLTAAQAINAMLPGMSCSWIDVQGPVQSGGPVKLAGAAGSPATVQDAVVDAATSAGVNLPLAAVDLSGVAPAGQGACSALDAFRDFKDASTSLVSPAASYTITRGPDGKLAGQPIVTVAPRNPAQDFTLLRIDPQGRIEVIYANRQAFNAARQGGGAITDLGGDAYGVQADPLNANGWSGLVLITGKGPFDENLLTKPPGARDVAWITQVRQAGDAGGWKSSMVWYKVQNNAAPPARVRAKPQGYYAHPGATGGNGGDESVPTQTEPQPSSGAPPAKRTSVWQRMFGSSSSSGSPQR